MPIMMAEDESIIFNNILVFTEVSVRLHMKVKVIVRVTGGGGIIQKPNNPTQKPTVLHKNLPLPAALHKLLRQDPVEQQENPVVRAVAALKVHGGLEKQRRE